jgi:quercetin dioxygenase-like cupin family protein
MKREMAKPKSQRRNKTMAVQVRRVVTGHDPKGRAVVKIDEIAKNVISRRPGQSSCVIWTTEGFPVNNTGDEEGGTRQVGTTLNNGTVFRLVEFGPGVAPRNHRTDSIDYAVVLSGEIDMELDDSVVHLKAGDVVVQRGTIHNWLNRGTSPCTIAFVLIDAKPVEVDGKALRAEG